MRTSPFLLALKSAYESFEKDDRSDRERFDEIKQAYENLKADAKNEKLKNQMHRLLSNEFFYQWWVQQNRHICSERQCKVNAEFQQFIDALDPQLLEYGEFPNNSMIANAWRFIKDRA